MKNLKISTFLVSLLLSHFVLGWGSLVNNSGQGYGAHQAICRFAYQIIEKDPAFKDSGFPTLAEILRFEGVKMFGDDETGWGYLNGNGPDVEGASDYSSHYYNPVTQQGDAPKSVEKHFNALSLSIIKKSPTPKDAAWGAHFLADMSVPYHVRGMSYSDLLLLLDKYGRYANGPVPLDTSITGDQTYMSYDVTGAYTNFRFDINKFFEAREVIRKAGKSMYLNWFDPWYWNGSTAISNSHLMWETSKHSVGSINQSDLHYNNAWIYEVTTDSINVNEKMGSTFKELAKHSALQTVINSREWIESASGALTQAVQDVATLWRGSFSGLRTQTKLITDKNGQNYLAISFKNLTDEEATGMAVRVRITGGGKLNTAEETYRFDNLYPENAAGARDPIYWPVTITDPKAFGALVDLRGHFAKTPDIGFHREYFGLRATKGLKRGFLNFKFRFDFRATGGPATGKIDQDQFASISNNDVILVKKDDQLVFEGTYDGRQVKVIARPSKDYKQIDRLSIDASVKKDWMEATNNYSIKNIPLKKTKTLSCGVVLNAYGLEANELDGHVEKADTKAIFTKWRGQDVRIESKFVSLRANESHISLISMSMDSEELEKVLKTSEQKQQFIRERDAFINEARLK